MARKEEARLVLEARAYSANAEYGARWEANLPDAKEAFESVINPWFRNFKVSEPNRVLAQLGYRGLSFTLATHPVFYPKHALDELRSAREGKHKAFELQAQAAVEHRIDVETQIRDFGSEIWRAELYIGPAQKEAGLFVRFQPAQPFLDQFPGPVHRVYPGFHTDEQIIRGDFSTVKVLERIQPDVIIGFAQLVRDGRVQEGVERYATLVTDNHPLRASLAEESCGYRTVLPLVAFVDSCRRVNGFSRNGTN